MHRRTGVVSASAGSPNVVAMSVRRRATLRATQGKFDVIYLKFMQIISICNSIHNNCFELSLAIAYDSRVLMSFVI